MDDYINTARNFDTEEDVSNPNCTLHMKEICLYCTDCHDVLCPKCLVEKHQKHSVRDISDALEIVKEKVEQWCSEQSTISDIIATKDQIQKLGETSKQAEITCESDLRKAENDFKKMIEDEANQLSDKLKVAFQKHVSDLQRWMDEITECKKSMDSFKVNSESRSELLQLYCRLKSCVSKELKTQIDTLQQPNLCLYTDISFSLGLVKSSLDEGVAQVAKPNVGSEKTTNDNKADPERNSTKVYYLDEDEDEVTKILPVGDEEAWVVMNGDLYYLCKSELTDTKKNVRDIAGDKNGENVFILKECSTYVFQMTSKKKFRIFTSTNPHNPSSVAYLEHTCTLMVLTNQKTVFLFGLNGIMKQWMSLPFENEGQSLQALSCTKFSLVYKKSPCATSVVYSRSEKPTTQQVFCGVFGSNPESTFVCESICYDDDGYIVVADRKFSAIYRLNEKLEFEQILIDRKAGIVRPTALAFRNGLIWVADKNYISIHKYSDINRTSRG